MNHEEEAFTEVIKGIYEIRSKTIEGKLNDLRTLNKTTLETTIQKESQKLIKEGEKMRLNLDKLYESEEVEKLDIAMDSCGDYVDRVKSFIGRCL